MRQSPEGDHTRRRTMPPRRGRAGSRAPSAEPTQMDVTTATDAAGSRAIELANARAALQDALDRAENLGHVSLPPESVLKVNDLLDYARRISYTTHAPSGYAPGAPLNGIMPPAPQEEHFQVSNLARHAAEVKAKAKAKATEEEARKKEEERRRLLEQVAAISPEELIARLSAWKPGEPWPEGIPPPPPGWKPGDPLHFDLPKPRGDEGVGSLVKPTSTIAQAKPAARVVPFVSLDLNPDLDDDDDVRSISDDFEEVSESDGEDSD